jgi:hypothetical protein
MAAWQVYLRTLRTLLCVAGPEGLRIAIMTGFIRHRSLGRSGFLAVLLLSTVSVKANPVNTGGVPVFQLGNLSAIIIALLIESLCVVLLLRRRRTPRLFLLWLLGMHVVTYPAFLGWLWLALGLNPFLAILSGEAGIVLLEGGLIYLMCRFMPSAKSEMPLPSVSKSLFASLAGNTCSAMAFPLLMMLAGWVAFSIVSAISD